MRPAATLWVLLALLGGCTVGPDYEPPTLPAPAQWSEAPPPTDADVTDLTQWWRSLGDPVLDALIERAATANLDLRSAAARVREARAQRRIVAGAEAPEIGANGSFLATRLSENGFLKSLAGGSSGAAPNGAVIPGTELNLWEVGFDASWELDLFGGTRRAVEAADAELEAAVENARDVRVTLLAEIARNYVEVRAAQTRLDLANASIAAQEETLDVIRQWVQAGISSELDQARAQAQLASTRAELPAFEAAMRQGIHRLGVLVGEPPQALLDELQDHQAIPTATDAVPVGLPSELLRRRPDLRQAERELAAATARIGVATAELYPHFSLTGAFGLQSQDLGDLPKWESRFWSIGPAVRWSIFAGGRVQAAIEVADARAEQALLRYQQAFLVALQDVEDSLVGYRREQQRHQALADAVAAEERALELAQQLYRGGIADFLTVLDAQRSLYDTQDRLAQSQRTITTELIAVYKALGGGWAPPAAAPTGERAAASSEVDADAGQAP